jgi:hypothetical protein
MIWQNPWALLGLLALAVPLLIHLLGRRNARVLPFPTLRFLAASQLRLTRRARVTDWLLLIVRLGIVAAAAVALAQPLILGLDRRRELDRALARVIIVDTSASMRRATSQGTPARDVARTEAGRLAADAVASSVLESAAPAQTLEGAAAWLRKQTGRREIAILSDFQLGTVGPSDLAVVPAEIGLRLHRIDVRNDTGAIETVTRLENQETVARITLGPEHTDVEWSARPIEPEVQAGELRIMAGAAERAAAQAAARAARTFSAPATGASHPVAIVHPQFEGRAQLARNAEPLHGPWMADVLMRIRADALLVAAAASADARAGDAFPEYVTVLARTSAGATVAVAASGRIDGRAGLLVFSLVDAQSLASAALNTAILRALASASPAAELEPETLSAATLQNWQRAPGSYAGAADPEGPSDGHWVWLIALALLALETWLRRTPHQPRAVENVDARAA